MVSISICFVLLCSGICAYVRHTDGSHVNGKSAWDWHGEAMARSNHQAKNKDRIPVGPCGVCTKIVGKLKDLIGDTNITKEKIEEKLKEICNEFKWPFKGACRQFVEKRKEKLTNIFLKTSDPKQACIAMKLCKSKHPGRISGKMRKFTSY